MSRSYKTIRALRANEVVDLEGIRLKMASGPIEPGDLYVAERNRPASLLTCESVNTEGGWINPVQNAYAYDIHECVKVAEAA